MYCDTSNSKLWHQHNFKHLKYSMNWLKSDCDDHSIEHRIIRLTDLKESTEKLLLFFFCTKLCLQWNSMNFIRMNKSFFFFADIPLIDNVQFGQINTKFVYFLCLCGGNQWIPRMKKKKKNLNKFIHSLNRICGLGFECKNNRNQFINNGIDWIGWLVRVSLRQQ